MSCLLSKPFLFFYFFQVHHPFFTQPDIDAINGQDDVYLEFVPIPDIVQLHTHSCKAINFISFDPLQPTIPCQRKCSTIIFLTGCHLLQNIMHSTCMIQVFHFTVYYIPTREPIQEMLICVLPWQNQVYQEDSQLLTL